jgi:solute carrier family 25 2-oxodicarboxylate transporter 21
MSSSKDTAGAPPTSTSSTPFWKNLVAGGTAGIAEVLCMYPTDVAKTRQVRSELARAGAGEAALLTQKKYLQQLDSGKSVGMLKIFREIIEKEGFHNLYRGIASPILAEAPKRAMKFTLNDVFKGMVKREDGSLPASRAALAGALAGMSECSVNVPFEVIKVGTIRCSYLVCTSG